MLLYSSTSPPTGSMSLFSLSASPLLHCTQVHQYHLSRFHVYALIYDICFSSLWRTSLCIIGSRFTPLIRTDSNTFLFMAAIIPMEYYWDGWMGSLIQWTWTWANSRRQWETEAWCATVHGVMKSQTWLGNRTATATTTICTTTSLSIHLSIDIQVASMF